MLQEHTLIKFYRSCIFKRDLDEISQAAERAYRDMCRTIDFLDIKDQSLRSKLENDGINKIKEHINKKDFCSQNDYDTWFRSLSDELKKVYQKQGVKLSLGQTQKWINMTMKYLLCFDNQKVRGREYLLHVPIDKIVVEAASELVPTDKLLPWSDIDDYKLYSDFQNNLRTAILEKQLAESPIIWEFNAWSGHK